MRLTITETGQSADVASRAGRSSRSALPGAGRCTRRSKPGNPDRITRLRRQGDVIELALVQTHLRSVDAERLRAEVVAWHRPGDAPRIVLSLRGLEAISGGCVGTLAELAALLGRVGGSLVLRDVPAPTSRMLKRSGLSKTLRIARSGAHARRLAMGAARHGKRAA
ncbi:MAG: STAS domain-containing protein [Planctomycetota bacterium]